MSIASKRVLIAGAGPGGLTAALALNQAGFDVEVFERARSTFGGSGFTLWPNALQALDKLGLGEEIRAISIPFDGLAMLERSGKVLFRITGKSMTERFGYSGVAVEREHFLRILMGRLRPGSVHFGRACEGFRQNEFSVTAFLSDASEVTGAALVGADGLRSVIRRALFGFFEPRFAGYRVLRGVCELPLAEKVALTSLGRGLQFGIFPMAKNRVYWFASTAASQGPCSSPESAEKVLFQFSPWHEPVHRLIERTSPDCILQNDIFDTDPLQQWSDGRVTLLGDAAHPATPDLGQGLCQAIEDAVVLARCMRQTDGIPSALATYETHRKPRTRSITLQSRRIGKSGTWTNALLCHLRNQAIRAMPRRLHMTQLEEIFHFEG